MRGTIEKEELLNFFSYIPAGSDEGRKLGQLVKQLETRPVHHVLESQRRDFARMDFVGVSLPSSICRHPGRQPLDPGFPGCMCSSRPWRACLPSEQQERTGASCSPRAVHGSLGFRLVLHCSSLFETLRGHFQPSGPDFLES